MPFVVSWIFKPFYLFLYFVYKYYNEQEQERNHVMLNEF